MLAAVTNSACLLRVLLFKEALESVLTLMKPVKQMLKWPLRSVQITLMCVSPCTSHSNSYLNLEERST